MWNTFLLYKLNFEQYHAKRSNRLTFDSLILKGVLIAYYRARLIPSVLFILMSPIPTDDEIHTIKWMVITLWNGEPDENCVTWLYWGHEFHVVPLKKNFSVEIFQIWGNKSLNLPRETLIRIVMGVMLKTQQWWCEILK